MTPNKKLRREVVKTKVFVCTVPKYNAAVTNNQGLNLLQTDKVIVTDADTVFEKGCIQKILEALSEYDVVKPRIVFKADQGDLLQHAVAGLRTFFNDGDEKMYIPGLSFNMNIKSKIGGYYFDEKIPWGEDSDFSRRVEKNRLKKRLVKDSILYHPSVAISHDLADALLIGWGKAADKSRLKVLKKRLVFHSKVFQRVGSLAFLYSLIWYLFFDIGRFCKHFDFLGRRMESYCWQVISKKK